MANRIRTLVHSVQLPAGKPPLDRTSSHTKLDELTPPHHPVLALRELGNQPVGGMKPPFSMHGMGNGGFVVHATDDRRLRRVGGALKSAFLARKRGSSPPVPPLALIP